MKELKHLYYSEEFRLFLKNVSTDFEKVKKNQFFYVFIILFC